jgi:hypothetical protein
MISNDLLIYLGCNACNIFFYLTYANAVNLDELYNQYVRQIDKYRHSLI